MTDLFTETNQSDPSETTIDPNKDYFAELVGEDKKFKSPAELARAKAEADAFVERLKRENAGLRNELKTRTTLEDALDRLSNAQQAPTTNSNNQNNHNGEDEDRTALTPEKIAELVDQKVNEREQRRLAQQNMAFVEEKLKEAFGTNYTSRLLEETAALGLSKDQVNHLAATQPKVLLRIVNAEKPATPTGPDLFTPPRNQSNMAPSSGGTQRNIAFYNNLKKTDPNTYWSTSMQNQMHKDAVALGEAFFRK